MYWTNDRHNGETIRVLAIKIEEVEAFRRPL